MAACTLLQPCRRPLPPPAAAAATSQGAPSQLLMHLTVLWACCFDHRCPASSTQTSYARFGRSSPRLAAAAAPLSCLARHASTSSQMSQTWAPKKARPAAHTAR